MQQVIDRLTSAQAKKFVAQVEQPFKSVPHMPESWTEFLAKIAPYLAGLGGIFGILGGVSTLSYAFNFSSSLMWIDQMVGLSPVYLIITGLLEIVSGVLGIMAYKYLKARSLTGWMLMFWNMMLSLVSSVVAVILGPAFVSSLIGALIGAAIGLYILFEMKREYN